MKKFLFSVIIILIILLVAQLIYFNIQNNEQIAQANITNNTLFNTNYTSTNETENTNIEQNIIVPAGLDTIMERYKGNVNENYIEKEFYKFINTYVKQIYNLTARKSINNILQIYDLNIEDINNMHIYSANDFLEIATQTYHVANISGVTYLNSIADISTYNDDDNGYTTFKVTFNYSNNKAIELKIYLANNESVTPLVRFGVIS